ncbi:SET domain-containing protein [Ophiobolus disseminans]|uniref:SET domain-containing protein n=1 Tax=Ophiobolus disseminans TaxID=1469910 RepID=A0A6A6ZVW4_9PLEO|nr:SET domain-containing protein [Ophiobolus disseminans]
MRSALRFSLFASQIANFPWTFWPECFSNEETTEPYCVFSDQSFAAGRGIFIVTTKIFAYAMLEKPAFSNPKLLEDVNKYRSPPFRQHEFPGKGRGLVANTTLHRGDRIFASTPILITDSDSYALPTSERLALLYRGVATLPFHTQADFWALLGHFNDDPVDDRINTNNFDVNIDSIPQQALFPEIAMLNHDCRPNAAYFWDEQMMTHYVHAIRDIHPGEEITITYIDNEKDRKTRMRRLERNWGFKCSCSACTAHASLAAESDSRLYQITSLAKALDDWTSSSSATPEIAELLISLYKQERLDASLATAYKYAAEVYSSFGKKWEAMRYARLSGELSMLDKGFRDGDVREMKRMSETPELTWSWKKRVASLVKGCECGHAY